MQCFSHFQCMLWCVCVDEEGGGERGGQSQSYEQNDIVSQPTWYQLSDGEGGRWKET